MFWKDIAQHSKSYAVLELQYFEALVINLNSFQREMYVNFEINSSSDL